MSLTDEKLLSSFRRPLAKIFFKEGDKTEHRIIIGALNIRQNFEGFTGANGSVSRINATEIKITDSGSATSVPLPFIRRENKIGAETWFIEISARSEGVATGPYFHQFRVQADIAGSLSEDAMDTDGKVYIQYQRDGSGDTIIDFVYFTTVGVKTVLKTTNIGPVSLGVDYKLTIRKTLKEYIFEFDIDEVFGDLITDRVSIPLVKQSNDGDDKLRKEHFIMTTRTDTGSNSLEVDSVQIATVTSDFTGVDGAIANGALIAGEDRTRGALLNALRDSNEFAEKSEAGMNVKTAEGVFLEAWRQLFGVQLLPGQTEQETRDQIRALILFATGTQQDLEDKITFLTGQVVKIIDIPEDEAYYGSSYYDIEFDSDISGSGDFYSLAWWGGSSGLAMIVFVAPGEELDFGPIKDIIDNDIPAGVTLEFILVVEV